MRVVFDIETTGFLDHTSIDYTASPYKLRDTYKVHCIAVKDIDTGEIYTFVEDKCYTEFPAWSKRLTMLIGANIIHFDLLVLKVALGLDYTVGEVSTFDGRDVVIYDTLVASKVLNPDRYGGHSIAAWGDRLGLPKIDWRGKAIEMGYISEKDPKGAEFRAYSPEMLEYNIRDVEVNHKVYDALIKEWGDWDWSGPFALEQMTRDIITRQEHRGFWYDYELAEQCVRDLDEKMESIREIVEPLLPPKEMGLTKIKAFLPMKMQYKKNGGVSAVMEKWVAKHGGTFEDVEGVSNVRLYGKLWPMPMDVNAAVQTHEPATVKDVTHIKGWLVSLGWRASQYKERDLTCDSKKNKLSQEKFVIAATRYAEQTLASPFCKDRLLELNATRRNLLDKLLRHDIKRPLKVYTNPTITVGMEKEIDPALLELADKFPHAKLVSEYLTYSHRRNSILGGGVDPDEMDEDDEWTGKGFMASERIQIDHRIPTPADTCGAGTSRFKHKLVANIARVTSLYGDKMRAQFGVDVKDGKLQLGYDFDSLEAKIEAHYVHRYEGGPEYGVSLTADKPNDCHSVLAVSISEVLGRPFPRGTAKNVKYGCVPVDNTLVLTTSGWRAFSEVEVGSEVLSFDGEKLVPNRVSKLWFYEDAEVYNFGHSRWNVECTDQHRWLGKRNYFSKEDEFYTCDELQTNFSVRTAGEYVGGNSGVTADEAAMVAWLLSDGYYKWSDLPQGKSSRGELKRGLIANVAQASHKFQKELKAVMAANNLLWVESDLGSANENVNISYRMKATEVRPFIDRVVGCRKQKHEVDWTKWVLGLNQEALKSFLYNFWLADGSTTTECAMVIKQNRGNIADAVVLAGNLTGQRVFQSGGKCSVIRIVPNAYAGMQTAKLEFSRKADVFCLTTGSGTFVIKQGDTVTLTGNCSYNAQPARVAKTVGCSLEDATIIFDAFWTQAMPLKLLKENMQKYWETTGGKKFLRGLDGRKLPIRSKGNVINTAFQSAGVICAKRAMVIHEQKLKDAGLYVDFFRDDWKNKAYCQQLIAYHK